MTTERIDIVINESGGRTVKRSLDDIADSAQRGERSLNSLNGGLGGASQATAILTSSLKALGVALGALRLTSLISEASRLSQRYNELGIVLDVVGRNAGLMKSEVDATTEAVRKQGISMIESRQIVARMIQSQIELSKATQLARLAQDAAVIGQINSSEALDRLVLGITSAQVEVLRGIGINVSFEQSYTKLAKEMGVTQNALTEQQKLQARLNVVLDEASKLNGVYAGSMENAGKQMRSTPRLVEDLKVKIGGLFDQTAIFAVTAYTGTLKDADAQMNAFAETGRIKAWGDAIARTAAFAADAVRSVGIVFDIAGKGLGAFAAQAVSIANLDFKGAASIGKSFGDDFDAAIGSMSKMRDLVESQITQRDMLTKSSERETLSLKSNTQTLDQNASAVKGNGKEREGFLKSLQNEVESIGKNEFALKRMQAAKLGAADAAEPLIATLEQENKRLNQQEIAVNSIISDLNKYKQVTESVMTDQERFAAQVEELNRLRSLTNGAAISEETYARALKKTQEEFDATKKKGRETFDSIDQYAIQGARNIQTSLANFLFNPFDDGLKGMVKGVIDAVRRMVAEFAAMKIAQTIGLTSLFQGAGIAALGGSIIPSSAGSSSGGASNLLNIASLGSSALNLFKGGLGATSLIGSGLSKLGGFVGSSGLSAFGAGFAGDAIGGLAAGGFTSGAASAASMGASFASFAGPAIAIAAVDQITRLLAGDKLIGGGVGKVLNYVPVLGPLLNGLFGRGQMKQQGTLLTGEIGAEGFESGYLQTRFKAKGGLFRSDKIDFARVDAVTGEVWTDNNKLLDFANDLSKTGKELFGLINDTTKQTSSSLRQIGQDLGVSTEGIDNFKHSINLLSEKGKMLTEEQIGEEIQKITDGLAHSLLPQVDELAKRGETALQTVSRLGTEFTSLVDAATVLLGKSAADARSMVLGTSFEDRTGFVDKVGGPDALNQFTQMFSANFLSATERLAPAQENLNADLVKLGLSTDLTREGFRSLVQSFGDVNGVSADMLASLLKLMPAFLDVRAAQDQLAISAKNLQVRLLETQGNSGAALQLRRDMELDAADPSQRGTLREIYAAEDAAARFARVMDVLNTAQQKNIEIANQKYGLETQLLQLQGNTAELRKRELDALDPSNRALQERVFALHDEQLAAQKLAQIAQEKTNLETQLLQLQGNTAELRKRELDALDPANRALQQYIWTLEDQQTAMQKAQQAIETARSNAGSALSVLQKWVGEERKGVEVHIANITASVGKLRDLSGALQSTLGRMTIAGGESDQRAAAQAQITAALTIARASGSLPEADSLRQALDIVAQPSEDLFGSFTDYMRDFARTAADINALDSLAQNQIGVQEQSLALEQSQLTYLDGLLTTAQAQIDAINGVDTSVKSLGVALSGFQAAVASVATAKSDAATIAAKPVPKFATGGYHAGGLRIVGERGPELEFTGPSRILSNKDTRQFLDLSEVVAELRAVKEELAEIKKSTNQTASLLDDVSAGGGAFLVESAS